MSSRWMIPAASLVLALTASATPAQAQGTWSVIPTFSYVATSGNWVNSYTVPTNFVDNNNNQFTAPTTYSLKAKGGPSVGLIVEYSLNKHISLAGQVGRTLGGLQRAHEEDHVNPTYRPISDFAYDVDMATTNLNAMLVFRPLGRTPSGAPKTIYIEVGGGVNIYDVSRGFQSGGSNGDDFLNYTYHSPTIMAGVGFSFPVGRRVSLQLFGRGYMQTQAYNAPALASVNGNINQFSTSYTNSPVPKGEKPLLIQIGAGLRVGR